MLSQLESITAVRWTGPLKPRHDGQVAWIAIPCRCASNVAGTGGQPGVIERLSPSRTTASRPLAPGPLVSEPLVTVNRPGGHGEGAMAAEAVVADPPARSHAERPGTHATAMDAAATDRAHARHDDDDFLTERLPSQYHPISVYRVKPRAYCFGPMTGPSPITK